MPSALNICIVICVVEIHFSITLVWIDLSLILLLLTWHKQCI